LVDIVALDPGVTIGIASFTDGRYITSQLIPTNYPHPHETLLDVLSEMQPKVLLYERFDFRAAKNGVVLKGVEYIGIIELVAQLRCIDCYAISASDGKAFWTNDKLKALGLYATKPVLPHAMDALRILLTYQMKNEEFKLDMLKILKQVL